MADKKKKTEETEFLYDNPKAAGRGIGAYPIDDPGMGRALLERAQVGDLNMPEFEAARKAAQARRNARRK